jgi:AAA+ superfamily predicted ATPase
MPIVGRQPYADAAEHLFAYLERASWLLGESRVEVERAVERDDEIAAREALSSPALPLIGLRTRAGLDQPATHALVMAAITGLDVDLGILLVERTKAAAPSVQQIISLLAFAAADEAVLLAAFAPDAPLRALGLIELRNERAPLLHRTVHVDDRVIAFLRGEIALDHELADFASVMTSAPASEASHAIARLLGTDGPIVVDGAARVGKTAAIVAAAASHGRRTLVADLARLQGEPEALLQVLARLRREAMLLDAVFVVRLADVDLAVQVARRLAEYAQLGIAIVTVYDATTISRALRGPRVIRVANPPASAQLAIWRASLGDIDGIERVVERYPLPPGDIELAAAAARAQSEVHGRPLAHDDLMIAARARLLHRLGEVAELVSTTLTWDDLVVRDDVDTRLVEIVAAVRYQSRVMEDWGFSAKLPYGRSLSVLFSGAPGTGKTMVATLIGKELGLEVFRVDLSKIVSKYIGETEKNLARVFEEAQRCNAVILFDEADSLFAKRTEVKSSNDRYANLEVNFLLQRLEAHDGIVILTTNAANSIDPAFLRRIRYRVEFPEPDEHERKGLWRSMVPVQTPLASDVDFAALGRKFRLTGGHIKNAVVRAAFLAAAEGTPAITQDLLLRAAQLEWTELGNLPGV